MVNPNSDLLLDSRISLLTEFKIALQNWFNRDYPKECEPELRSFINRKLVAVKNAVRDAGTQKRITVPPPLAVGGLVIQNADPFDDPFGSYWGFSVIPAAIDSIEQAIGVYEHMKSETGLVRLSSREAIDIETAIERALRPSFRSVHPENERDVQDAVENILNALGVDFVRDREVAPVGPKAFRPDFTVPNLNLAIEVKLATKSHRAGKIQKEINADISGYQTKWKRLLVVVYDCGVIEDPYQMRRDNLKLFGVSVVIVKH
jgi:hypothetical protein